MTVSGIRGVVGESLTAEFVARVAYVQTSVFRAKRVVVGRDTRPSGAELAKAVFKGVRAAGAEPIDVGIAPTPTTCLATAELAADTGVIVTASHNPGQYNGYKMVHGSGRLFDEGECNRVYRQLPKADEAASAIAAASATPAQRVDAAPLHIERILAAVDTAVIREAGISIAVDSVNGAGGAVFPALLERLGVRWVGVHNALDGVFLRNPEPRPENLDDLRNLLRTTPGLWGGFAFDPDADRLAPMAEDGRGISEEMTLALALDTLLERRRSPVATNLSTSMVIDDVARRHGVRVIRTKIGEANVVAAMRLQGCAVGGEGNGGVIYPAVVAVRDGLTALALIVEAMARTGLRLGALAGRWTEYPIVKEKILLQGRSAADVMAGLERALIGETVDRQDGLKVIRDYGWVHVRPSNTEPVLRCIAEGRTLEEAQALAHLVLRHLPGPAGH
jgi:phosphomannomutase